MSTFSSSSAWPSGVGVGLLLGHHAAGEAIDVRRWPARRRLAGEHAAEVGGHLVAAQRGLAGAGAGLLGDALLGVCRRGGGADDQRQDQRGQQATPDGASRGCRRYRLRHDVAPFAALAGAGRAGREGTTNPWCGLTAGGHMEIPGAVSPPEGTRIPGAVSPLECRCGRDELARRWCSGTTGPECGAPRSIGRGLGPGTRLPA